MLRFYLTTSFLLFLSFLLQAQPRNYHVQHYTANDGLPQNSVTGIVFDKAGYCWFSTEMGLVRFDGKSFTVFNAANLPDIYSPRIRFCSSDNDGEVYMEAEKGELIRIKAGEGQIASYPQVEKGANLWLWNTYSHVPRFVAAKNRKRLPEFSVRSAVSYSYLLSSGDIYCIDGDKLYYLDDDRLMLADTGIITTTHTTTATSDCFIVMGKKQPIKWWKKGRRQKDLLSIRGPLQQSKAFLQGNFDCYYNSGQGYVYAGGTLYSLYEENGELTTKTLLEGLDISVLASVYYNAEQKKYYLGSLVSGLYVISPSAFNSLGNQPEIISKSVYGQAINSRGEIICQRFLYEWSGKVREIPLNPYVGPTLWLDNDRYLYYSDEPALFRYDFETNSNRRLLPLDSRPSSIFRDKFDTNQIIVGTSFAVGRFTGEAMHELKHVPGRNAIMSIAQTGKDSFILATKSGVKWYDFANNKVYREILDSVYTRNVYPEPCGRVWVATYGKGFYLFENGKVYSFPEHSTKALQTVHCFIEDGEGNFWLPTNNGLFVVKKSSLLAYAKGATKDIYFYLYSTLDNLPTNEFNGGCTPAYIWTKDSLLSIPSIEGLIQFDPRKTVPIFPDKKIYAEEYRLNDKTIQTGSSGLSLDPDYGNLTIKVSSPYFGNRENLQMVYMVKGLDKDWQPMPENNRISLSHIPAGNYQLLVRKLSGHGISEYDSFEFAFSVNPFFYNTWWFYILLFILACLIGLIAVRLRTKILKERNAGLQAIIWAQTADLSKTVEQLKTSEQALKESNLMKDRVTTMVLHDMRSPIRFLHTVSDQLLKKHDSLTPAEIKEKLGVLQSSTGSLNEFTEQFFTWAASQHRDFKIQPETFLLQPLFNELEELYADIAKANNNHFIVESTLLQANTDKNILSVIIRNLLDNACKNTANGWVRLSAGAQADKLVIAVADTGPGLDETAIATFFEGNGRVGSSRNGSSIVINLLEKIEGRLEIISSKDQGTSFNVELNYHQ
ncbi:MAG: ATP-binding protein [Chitinophagaceae bacterium]